MKVALVHYWLVSMRGGEKTVEALLELFPEADIFTHVYAPEGVSPAIRARGVRTTFIQKLPQAVSRRDLYLPLMPLALARLDLRDYDLVISSESGPAKGVCTAPGALHLCYCHTPMRYVWDQYREHLAYAGFWKGLGLRLCAPWLRRWDRRAAAGVDQFIANSHNVSERIFRHYGRSSTVVHPPVDVRAYAPPACPPEPEDYYLYVGQLAAYKRADLAVRACARLGRRLLVVGEGPERRKLEALAGPTVEFLGRLETAEVARLMQRCRALLFPGEEDFGMVPVEVQAAGRPVVAFGRGGALESVEHGKHGLLFDAQSVEALCRAVRDFESGRFAFNPAELAANAARFAPEVFAGKMREALASASARHAEGGGGRRGKGRRA